MKWNKLTDRALLADLDLFLIAVAYDDGTCNRGEATISPDGALYWSGGPGIDIESADEVFYMEIPDGPIHSKARR